MTVKGKKRRIMTQNIPQAKITRPRYMAPQRNKKEIKPLKVKLSELENHNRCNPPC